MAAPSLVMRALLRTEFVNVGMDYAKRIVVLERRSAPFRQPDDADRTISALAKAIPDHLRAHAGILVDMRSAPVRANPELELAFQRYRAETERGFARVAVLVQTPLGKMRSDRLMTTSKTEIAVFLAWDDALSWLIA